MWGPQEATRPIEGPCEANAANLRPRLSQQRSSAPPRSPQHAAATQVGTSGGTTKQTVEIVDSGELKAKST